MYTKINVTAHSNMDSLKFNHLAGVGLGFPAELCYASITRNRSVTDFVITRKKLFITRNYVLRVIASFENETKRNVITRNFQLNETGETTILRVFSTFESLFSSRVSSRIPLRVNYA
jgi:hypothetical protein